MGIHPKAHQPLNRFCVHCGAKSSKPECDDCRRAYAEADDVDSYSGHWHDVDGVRHVTTYIAFQEL